LVVPKQKIVNDVTYNQRQVVMGSLTIGKLEAKPGLVKKRDAWKMKGQAKMGCRENEGVGENGMYGK
jgi:hypothetical protein